MKAALLHAFREPLTIERVADPTPAPDGVVIAVRANGICRSDWHGWMGHDPTIRLPHVPGHEFSGVVVDVGPAVRNWQRGDRVTAPFCCGCGHCASCQRGYSNVCDHEYQPGFTGWGAFAELVSVPHADFNLVRLPDSLDFIETASLGCRFMTAYGGIVGRASLESGEWLAVYGCGGVGLSAIMIGAALGANIVAVDIDDSKLAFARSLGAHHSVNAGRDNAPLAIRELSGGGADVAVDALGSRQTCCDSVLSLRKRGRHVQLGLLLAGERQVAVPMAEVISRELQLLGVHGMPGRLYPAVLELVGSGRVQPKRLIGKTVTLEQASGELAAMGEYAQRGVTVITEF